jgi:hypothetical protein
MMSNITCTRPASKSVRAGADPRYGTSYRVRLPRPFLTGAGTLIQPHGLPGRDRALDGVSRF